VRILDAPQLAPVVISFQTGQSRAERRHVRYTAKGQVYLIPRADRQPATNVPYLRDQSFRRRGDKARRHARRRSAKA
jgi:hypothetical protein